MKPRIVAGKKRQKIKSRTRVSGAALLLRFIRF
jgi:hypothetical protein